MVHPRLGRARLKRALAPHCGAALGLALAIAGALGGGCSRAPATDAARTAVGPPLERGVALGLFATDPGFDYAPLLDEIAALGASDVQLDVVWEQTNIRTADIAPRDGVSPTDETVARTIAQARERGLRVTLFPIVRPREHTGREWRGVIAPADGVDAWFVAYQAFLLRMAALAETGRAERMSVGSELCSLERHEPQWRALIAAVRARYHGALLYSANWDQLDAVAFWDALDVAGATAYFELSRDGQGTDLDSLRAAWREPMRALSELRGRAQKPVIITELGFPSHADAARAPWDETRRAPRDLALQARLVRASCDAVGETHALDGFTYWNWFGFGGVRDTGYTPRAKPAARELRACFARMR